jgi:hypothetical protein
MPPEQRVKGELAPGTLVDGRWKIVRFVAVGGAGQVYEGVDLDGGRVAVKLYRGGTGQPGRQREIDLLLGLGLPGIATFVGYGSYDGTPCLVTRWVEGTHFGGSEERMTPEAVTLVLIRLLQRLERLGRIAGVVHGDIKPDNLLLDEALRPVLLDFDAATVRGGSPTERGMGTTRWAAPELLIGQEPTPATDIFGAGAVAWRALTGVPPFDAADLPSLWRLRMRGTLPTPPPELADHPLLGLLRRMLALEPSGRPSVEQALQELQQLRTDRLRLPWLSDTREAPLSVEELSSVFAGPERVLGLASRAARLVFEQTCGHPRMVLELLQRWIDEGFATWTPEGQLRVTPAQLDGLEVTTELAPVEVAPSGLPPEQVDLLNALHVAWPATRPEVLAGVLERPLWQVRSGLVQLKERDLVAEAGGDRWLARAASGATQGGPAQKVAWHQRLAGSTRLGPIDRLRHLLAVGGGELVEAAVEGAASLIDAAQPDLALAWLERAAERARRDGLQGLGALAAAALGAALEQPRADGLAAAVRIAQRCGDPLLIEVTRATQRLSTLDPTETVRALPLPEQDPIRLLVARVRAYAMARMPLVEGRRGIEGLLAQIEETPETYPWRCKWLGLLLYREGRFAEAAELHHEARRVSRRPTARVRFMVNEVAARMEAGQVARALEVVDETEAIARQIGFVWGLVRATVARRQARYRACAEEPPDPELPDAVAPAGWPYQEGLLAMTEATFAFRCGERSLTSALARRAVRCVDRHGPVIQVLCLALDAWARGDRAQAGDVLQAMRATPMPAAVRVQILGLCGGAREEALALLPEGIDRLRRREVLSLAEAIEMTVA